MPSEVKQRLGLDALHGDLPFQMLIPGIRDPKRENEKIAVMLQVTYNQRHGFADDVDLS
jgi:hypothetical protein